MKTSRAVLATASAILFATCGGGGGTPTTPSTPAPTPAAKAEVGLSITPTSPVALS